MEPVPPPTARLANIDALRGVAALLVVWFHLGVAFEGVSGSLQWIGDAAQTVRFGDVGVFLFFLISGFVIPSSFDRPGSRRDVLRVFVVRRFFRLFPLYWLTIPFGLAGIWVLAGRSVDWETVAANFTMIPEYLGRETIVRAYWTLAPELVFYCLCTGLFVAGLLRSTAGIVGAGLVLLALFLAGYFPFADSTPLVHWRVHEVIGQLSLMLTGAVVRRWHDKREAGPITVFGAAILLVFWLAGAPLFLGDPAYAIALIAFLAGVFVVHVGTKAAVAVGQASYSLYLTHQIVLAVLVWALDQPLALPLRGLPFPVYAVVGGGLSLVVAAALYRLVELPAIALGRRLTEGVGPRAGVVMVNPR